MDPMGYNGMSANGFFMFLKSRPDIQGHLSTDQIPNNLRRDDWMSTSRESFRETGLF